MRYLTQAVLAAAAAAMLGAAQAHEGAEPPVPEFRDLSVGAWLANGGHLAHLRPFRTSSIRIFTQVPKDLRGIDVLVLLDGWDGPLKAKDGAQALSAVLKRFVERGGTLVAFPPRARDDAPDVLPVGVTWAKLRPDDKAATGFPMEFLEPEHPAVAEIGLVQKVNARMTVSKPARVIVRHAATKAPMIAAAEVGKGRVVILAFNFSGNRTHHLLRSVGLWAAGKARTAPPPRTAGRGADLKAIAADHLARGFGGVLLNNRRAGPQCYEEVWAVELAKVKPMAAALANLILDKDHPKWRPGTEHSGWKAVETMITALGSRDPAARYCARGSLLYLAPVVYEPLRAAAGSSDPLVRAGAEEIVDAYERAAQLCPGNTQYRLTRLLCHIRSSVRRVRTKLDITAPMETLAKELRSKDRDTAMAAVRELSRSKDPRAAKLLTGALSGTGDGRVQLAIAKALIPVKGDEADRALAAMVEATDAANFRRMLPLMQRCRDDTKWRRAFLARALDPGDPSVRLSVVPHIRAADGPVPLVTLLDDPQAKVRIAAATQLVAAFSRTQPAECHAGILRALADDARHSRVHRIISAMRGFYRSPGNAHLVPEAAAALAPWLELADPPPAALATARYLRDKHLVGPLVGLLYHPKKATRGTAYSVLSSWAATGGYHPPVAGGLEGPERAVLTRSLKKWLEAHPDFLDDRNGSDRADAAR